MSEVKRAVGTARPASGLKSQPSGTSLDALARRFPQSFLFGAATAAYQTEGSVDVDGRVPSIWDRFSHTPGTTADGRNGDVATDHYRRWREDVDLAAWMGLRSYRLSIAWPRVMPDRQLNRAGIDFYRRLVESLRERDIVPMVTLYHWDLPQSLQEAGGWTNRDTGERFAEYAATVASELSEFDPLWLTHNEPWVHAFLGHGTGLHAPGLKDWSTAFTVAHEILRSHGLAVSAIRAAHSGARIGIAPDVYSVEAASSRPEDIAAAERMDSWRNRWILDPVLRGAYPQEMFELVARDVGPAVWLRDGDLETIAEPIDFLGINFYWRQHVETGGPDDLFAIRLVPPVPPLTAMGWEVLPDRLEAVLLRLRRDYGDIPIYVTENGAAYDDEVDQDGTVRDPRRIDYLRRHIEAVARAREAGVDVRGYFVWSLTDNFEWDRGHSATFGLIHIDLETMRRTPKASAHWYRDLIAASASPLEPG